MIEPFTVAIEQTELADLWARLANTRLPEEFGAAWQYGVDLEYLRGLLAYWQDGYDWRAWEARLNKLDHFRTRIDGQLLHFVHVRSRHAAATPLLMIHGWPGSFAEFLGVIDKLTAPENCGGNSEDAFHLVLPSLPGYAFSEPPREPGWGPARTGAAFAELMTKLGYGRYGVQGGDWGAIVAAEMALADHGRIIGMHTNMPMAAAPAVPVSLTAAEERDIADMATFNRDEMAYALLHASKPLTLGVALNDSPAGQCAWIVEKLHSWSDCNGEIEIVINRDLILTNIMLYWLTKTGASSARFYYEFSRSEPPWLKGKIKVPTGVARFPKEMIRPPRAWVEETYNVVHWTDMPRGGHFAALEQPDLFVTDVTAFFRSLRH